MTTIESRALGGTSVSRDAPSKPLSVTVSIFGIWVFGAEWYGKAARLMRCTSGRLLAGIWLVDIYLSHR